MNFKDLLHIDIINYFDIAWFAIDTSSEKQQKEWEDWCSKANIYIKWPESKSKGCKCKTSYQFMEFMSDHHQEKRRERKGWIKQQGSSKGWMVPWHKNLHLIPKIRQSEITHVYLPAMLATTVLSMSRCKMLGSECETWSFRYWYLTFDSEREKKNPVPSQPAWDSP